MVLKLTGALTSTSTVTVPDSVEKLYIVENATTGSQTVTFKTASGSGVNFTSTGYKFLYSDGTNIVEIGLTTSPAGSNTQIQFNSSGSFGASANLTFDGSNVQIGAQGDLRLADSDSSNYVALQAPATVSSNVTLTLPTNDGDADQALITDGSGNLSFTTISGGTSWQAVKTSNFSAVAGEGYFVNTTSGAITATLPASPSIGDTFEFKDYAQTFATNNLTIDPNGNPFEGLADTNHIAEQNRMAITITYSDSTKGYVATSSANAQADLNSGNFNIVAPPYSVDFLVIAGGGGAGGSYGAGAGGAGGYRNSYNSESSGGGGSAESALSLTPGVAYTITVGAGGGGPTGGDSSISGTGITTVTSTGGGQGGPPGQAGGSGGGGSGHGGTQPGGAGTANQGRPGGNGSGGNSYRTGGGGGGAANSGNAGSENSAAGNGGNGVASTITGSSVTRGGGGGGGGQSGGSTNGGSGGSGGGGNGSTNNSGANAGTANTGGGSGAYEHGGPGGGSGVVIIRMATANYSGSTTGSPTVTVDGTDTVLTYTASGTYTG